jgi:hypothetical protein
VTESFPRLLTPTLSTPHTVTFLPGATMPNFATDIDLLHWEPNLLRDDASAVAQTLITGTGTLAGTTFTIGAGSLIDAHVTPEHVIVLGPPISGSFPVVSIDSATTLTLSVLYDQLYPDEGEGEPTSPGAGTGLTFSVRTFWPHLRIVSGLLLQASGLKPGEESKIMNADVLRRPCALGALQLIYTALAAASSEPASLLLRADLYERLYRRALRAAKVEIDLLGDGRLGVARQLGVLQLQRA